MNKVKNYNEIMQELKENSKFERYENDAKIKLNIGMEMLRARKRQNLSQDELAKKIETTQKVISKIENGEVDVGICLLSRVSKNLNFTAENFADIFECERSYKISAMSIEASSCAEIISNYNVVATSGDFHSDKVWEDNEEKSENHMEVLSYAL